VAVPTVGLEQWYSTRSSYSTVAKGGLQMNERIAKLANESGFDVDKTGTFGNYSEMHRLEKFAELIVKECLEIAIEEERHAPFEGPVETKIRQHFGVEE
jgi:hypothetical protein